MLFVVLAGEKCQLVTPSSWQVRSWTNVVTTYETTTPSHAIHDNIIHDKLSRHEPKVRVRDDDGTIIVHSHIWATVSSTCAGVVSHLLLEKSSWNRITPGGKRRYHYYYCDGRRHTLVMHGTKNSYNDNRNRHAYDILATITESHPEQILSQASNNDQLKTIMDSGYPILRSTFARDKDSIVVLQDTMNHLSLQTDGTIKMPPRWHCQKHALGQDAWTIFQLITKGAPDGLRTAVIDDRLYDPRWLTVEFNSADEAFSKARGYMLRCQRMRVKAGTDYHDAIDVIRIGFNIWFVLSPYMNAAGPVPFQTNKDLVAKTIVSLGGTRNKCAHVLEGQSISTFSVEAGVAVDFFIDARLWSKVFSVYSNSRQVLLKFSLFMFEMVFLASNVILS